MCRRLLIAAAMITAVIGCTGISVLSGPRALSAGDTATYVLSLEGSGGEGLMLHVIADVPASWSLLWSWYSATIGGVPVSGSGSVVTNCYFDILPPVIHGFQRICIRDGEFDTLGSDSGELTLEFAVTDVPEGEFALRFWFAATGADGTAALGPPTYAVINREPHIYQFVNALGQAAGVLADNLALAASGDGRTVLLGGRVEQDPVISVSVLDRDPLTGALNHNHHLTDESLDGLDDLAFAPGDRHAYGVDGSHLVCFQRDAATGQLTVSQIVGGLGGARRVTVSPDGASVYVSEWSNDAVSVFDRDPSSGALSFVETQVNWSAGIVGMRNPAELKVSPDGANVYVVGNLDSAIVTFDRDPITGTITYNSTISIDPWGLYRPWSVVISPDGNHVYVVRGQDFYQPSWGRVGVFSRDPESGQLSFVESLGEGDRNVMGLVDSTDVALSPDGRYLFVSASTSLVVFSRDAANGSLSFLNADFDQEAGVTGMSVPYQIALSADGVDLFYASYQSMAVFTVRSFADGFESGDTSAWSAMVP